MKTLNQAEFKALLFAYNQGWIDGHNGTNNFDEIVERWFDDEETQKPSGFLEVDDDE